MIVKFALARIGAVMIPINYMLATHDVQYILEHAGVSALIASEEFAPILDQAAGSMTIKHRYLIDMAMKSENDDLPPEWCFLDRVREGQPISFVEVSIADDDLAQVLYTSGTESRPKGVMLSHKSLLSEYVSCIIDGKMEDRSFQRWMVP